MAVAEAEGDEPTEPDVEAETEADGDPAVQAEAMTATTKAVTTCKRVLRLIAGTVLDLPRVI
jgi:hypothetical protein